ncbi:MAG: CsgG/HfaB family protein [Acidobacteriota bacterium]|nr:CsgG/HfaB family protein [Acidobacteriota bacterium]MDQ7088327.1 CsgG/HfaB family protein [Acidobacteriota bacterium]
MIRESRLAALAVPVLVLAAALFSSVSTAVAKDDARLRVAVIDFDTEALHGSWRYSWHWSNLSKTAAANLAEELFKTGRFRVIERQRLDAVLSEQNLGDSGRIDATTAARIGKILGVQLVVIGSVTEFGIKEQGGRLPQIGKWKWGRGLGGKLVTSSCALTARLVDTTTAEILAVGEAASTHKFAKGEFAGANLGTNWDSGMASKVLAEAVEKLAADIAAGAANVDPSTLRGGLVGKIAKVAGDKIYVNLGSASGVKAGDRFAVTALGEAIIDPDTGENLGGIESEIGEIEIVQVAGAKLSVARPVSGSGFAAGNKISMK